MAEVVPIPKEGDPKVPANNRPISLLPILSKVIERLAKKQFSDSLTSNTKLSIHQSGNKKHNSTETALVYVTDQLLKAVDEKTLSLLVLLDMSKAFDGLDHNFLLSCADLAWCSRPFPGFLAIYHLESRGPAVKIPCISEVLPIEHGVPQGSILGLILFTIYVCDLVNEVSNSQAEMYVDDCQLFLKIKVSDLANAISAVNNDIIRISTQCSHNSLLIKKLRH